MPLLRSISRLSRQDPSAAFAKYVAQHHKVYHSERQAQARRAAFVSNLEYVVQQNGKFSQPCAPSDASPPGILRIAPRVASYPWMLSRSNCRVR